MSQEKVIEAKKQWVPIYFILLSFSIIAIIYLLLEFFETQNQDYLTMASMIALLSALIGYNFSKLLFIKIPVYRTVKIISCPSCGYSEEKPVEKGDYVFKIVGKCPKCGAETEITKIYRFKLETEVPVPGA